MSADLFCPTCKRPLLKGEICSRCSVKALKLERPMPIPDGDKVGVNPPQELATKVTAEGRYTGSIEIRPAFPGKDIQPKAPFCPGGGIPSFLVVLSILTYLLALILGLQNAPGERGPIASSMIISGILFIIGIVLLWDACLGEGISKLLYKTKRAKDRAQGKKMPLRRT